MNYTIRTANWSEDREALSAVRGRVFIEEQSVPRELEWDGLDEEASHWLASDEDNVPIGTLRMLSDGHIGRMAVLPEWRRQGVGMALLQAALEQARKDALFEVYLYAQTTAVAFYRRADFTVYGDEFMDAGLPHLTMRRQLAEQRILGQHGGDFAPASLLAAAETIIPQVDRHLRILSFDLDPPVFDRETIVEAISALARKSRYTKVRILVIDNSKLVARGHRLLKLQRRLSSSIGIRQPRNELHEIRDNLIIADQCGVVTQSIREPENIRANFNNRPVALNHISQFDDLWERANLDPNLRQLEI